MPAATLPPREDERLAALRSFQILGTPPDPRFDAFTRAAARVFRAPTSLVSLVDDDRQWFKSRVGMAAPETPRDWSFCAHAILDPRQPLVVDDATRDPRFADNPLVLSKPNIRFYAGAPLLDEAGHVLGTLCVIDSKPRTPSRSALATLADLAAGVVSTMQLHRGMLRLHAAASTDPLTGLANRGMLTARLEEALAEGRRSGAPFALLCVDLDRFKAVNDLFGHAAGDVLLAEAARRLASEARAGDVVARLGGDEFALLAAGIGAAGHAEALAQRIVDRLAEPLLIEAHALSIRASVGIALHPGDGEDAAGLLAHADAALFRAKRDGRGRAQRYLPAIGAERAEARLLERDLRIAIERERFTLSWQPIVCVADGAVGGHEALLRWDRPGRGPTLPGEFIELAERLGLICRIDRWVLREACRQAARWREPARVAVNVSAHWFHSGDLAALVAGVLAGTGLDPDRLELEVTERTLLDNESRARVEFARLRALGVRIVLDDFGTGYSSLAYLVRYRFDKIKLSGLFVSEIGRSGPGETVLRSVLRLCADLGLQACAESVETQAQLAFLRAEGCAEVQGYLTGAAVKQVA